jgi:hypothetical protein
MAWYMKIYAAIVAYSFYRFHNHKDIIFW